MSPVGSHSIGAGNGTEGYGMLIGTLIAHNTDGTHSTQENNTCLPYLIVEGDFNLAVSHSSGNASSKDLTGFFAREFHLIIAESADIDIISILKNTNLLRSDVAQNTDSKSGAREWMTGDEMLGHF